MRLPLDWLHEYCRPELDAVALGERLTLTGLELERIEHHGVAALERFVVGRVLEAEPHPDADRLTVCKVDVGAAAPEQIVCGAPNVAAGQTVAVARPGAVMPDGTELGVAKLRGVESHGMILAEDELAIGADHARIMVLEDDGLAPGVPLSEVLPIATEVLELETFHNRPDTLGVYGLAREVHAATGAALGAPPWADDPGRDGVIAGVRVEVECPDLCPRFTARVFEGVTLAPSPPWLKARLMAMGQRPINNVVDITNYAMLLTSQPLHAFDLDRVEGSHLVVRRARDGEEVETLDGQIRRLDAEMVVIDDEQGPTSIAGVMGGARSEVGEGTTRVLMEVATWIGGNIHRTSTRLGLRSEASARFERQLSREAAMEAQAVAAQLMTELCGATLAPGTVDVGGPGPERPPIKLRPARAGELLGVSVAAERCAEILESLGFGVQGEGEELSVSVPHHRGDVSIEEDLIEEIARIDGLDRLPATLPAGRPGARLTPRQRLTRSAQDALAGRGLHEIAGWSFTTPAIADALRLGPDDARRRFVSLANPMSEEQSVMRTTLLGSLLDAARHNAAHGQAAVRLFEEGAVYIDGEGELPDEGRHLGAVLTGTTRPPSWRDAEPPAVDFFAVKGVLAGLLDTLRVDWDVEPEAEPFLHPGRSARLMVGGLHAGWLGELHPLVARTWDLDSAAAFELDLGVVAVAAPGTAHFADLASFPSVREDLAIVVDEDVAAARVIGVVRDAAGELLADVWPIDVYRGAQAGEGKVSLALRLEFRAADRTLTDDEVAERRDAIAVALEGQLGASLRA